MSGGRSVPLIARLAAAGRLSLDAVSAADVPEGLAAAFDLWRRLGLPVALEDGALVWRPAAGQALDPGAVGAALAAAGQHCDVAIEPLIDSSNARLLDRAAAGAVAPQLLLAEAQSAGRGRRQRAWLGRYGESILLSLLLRPTRPPSQWPGLAVAAGVALAEALDQAGATAIGLKWPNDLVLGSGKLGGLLVEAAAGSAGGGAVVIGLGLNWTLDATTRDGLAQPAAALAGHLPPETADRSAIAGRLAAGLLAMARQFDAEGLAPFLERYRRYDVLRDRAVMVHVGAGGASAGIARGLAGDGALRVEHGGQLRTWHSADVTIRPA